MSADRYWILTARKLSGEITEAELAELAAMEVPGPENDAALSLMAKHWPAAPPPVDEAGRNRMLERLRRKMSEAAEDGTEPEMVPEISHRRSRRRSILTWSGLAAACLAGIFLIRHYTAQPQYPAHEIVARPGIKSSITLPDGTSVWLNAGSTLTYDEGFGTANRRIRLVGEAYFDVAAEPELPFVISAPNVEVTVLGTAFNLKAYEGESSVETALLSGSLQVKYPIGGKNETVLLKPMEKLKIDRSGRQEKESIAIESLQVRPGNDSLIAEIAWKDNTLICDREPFPMLAVRLERWFNVNFRIDGGKAAALEFTASLKGERLEEVLQALKAASGNKFDYEYDRATRTVSISDRN
ncbi:FecR family protein [Chitinophaga rhizosphaerae]|uniref:FecR family protein n=1 Tax=Chitinophaga rhizosphaerae TaxID=1864947 RepID=UPI000F7FEA3B|nr:FecR domain-containing protein [Chitinophaga rhizosphaerae]